MCISGHDKAQITQRVIYIEVVKHIGALNEVSFKPVATDVPGVFPGADDAQLA